MAEEQGEGALGGDRGWGGGGGAVGGVERGRAGGGRGDSVGE